MMNKDGQPLVVSVDEWYAEVSSLLTKEKELTRLQDQLNAQRRRLPMAKIDKPYSFAGDHGETSLLELFSGRRQLIIYHFMFPPELEEGCSGCSWVVDAMSHPAHLNARGTSLVLISRAPLEKLQRYKARMRWDLPWYSSFGSEFNFDFGATTEEGENHMVSVLFRDGDSIYRSYFTGDRGVEYLGSHWSYLDLTPYGRQEIWENSPPGYPQSEPYEWIRRHDDYNT